MSTPRFLNMAAFLSGVRSVLAALALASLTAPTAFAETGATNIINGTTKSYGGDYAVGTNGSFNALIVTNAGVVRVSSSSRIGYTSTSSNNYALVSGVGSLWSNGVELSIGSTGSFNRLTVNDGARVLMDGRTWMGYDIVSGHNSLSLDGTGSLRTTTIYIGLSGSSNSVVISNGGSLFDITGYLGYNASATGNSVTVTGSGSVWSNSTFVTVGRNSPGSSLTISDGGTVIASNMYMGAYATATGSVVNVSGGNLYLTNITRDAQLDVRWATFSLNTGTVLVNRLYVTNNANSVMNFSAGLLRSGGSTVSNGTTFVVGDGSQSATFDLLGGTHRFANGLKLSTNASLIGSGDIIAGSATNFGVIAPGHSAGTLTFSGDLTLTDSSTLNFEIGGNTTNDYDRVWVGGLLRIGGLLNMVLTDGYTGNAGDTFDLFNFSSATGTFSQTNLPALGAGKAWNTDRLYTLGEIQIIPEPGIGALLVMGLAAVARRHRSPRLRRGA
jgi:T5SS/PEP-CTERM-associated repeat protein